MSCLARSTSATAAWSIATPPICTDRDPPVTVPSGKKSVSPKRTSIWSIGTPVRSLMSIAHVVPWPWPYGVVPLRASSVPSGRSSTSPNSLLVKPAVTST